VLFVNRNRIDCVTIADFLSKMGKTSLSKGDTYSYAGSFIEEVLKQNFTRIIDDVKLRNTEIENQLSYAMACGHVFSLP
jgi:hypothetical protein